MPDPPVVTLGGYPPVHRIKFMQGSAAKPGRCVIDAGNDSSFNIRNIPRETYLSIEHRSVGFSGQWPYMRVVKCQRARNGHMRVVLEDQRWHLTQYKFPSNFNERDALGNVMQSTRASFGELLSLISQACQNKIQFTTSQAPGFDPPARWAGMTCMEAFKDLLRNTGCRAVYNPSLGVYAVGLPSGGLPNLRDQVFQPVPSNRIRAVHVHSYPKLYENKLDVYAARVDESTGLASNMTQEILDDEPTDPYSQTKYRLWRTDDTNKVITEFRPKSHLFDPTRPTLQRGRIIRDEWEPFPVHQPFVIAGSQIVDCIEDTSGGRVFVTEHPVLSAEGNQYSLQAKMVTGYYQRDGSGGLQRDVVTRNIDGGGSGEVNLYADWIRPIESDQPDVGTPIWPQLHQQVADALHRKYLGPSATISNPYPISFGGHPNVGEVEYDFRLSEIRSHHNFRVAINFSPGSEGEIR